MKSKFVVRFLLAIAFVLLFGQFVQRDLEKWHALGRDAFLAYQGHRFDIFMAHPGSGAGHIVFATILMVGLVAFYELVAFYGEKCWLLMGRGKTSTTPNC